MQEYEHLDEKYGINCSTLEAEEGCDFEDYSDGNQIDSYGDFDDCPENEPSEEDEDSDLGASSLEKDLELGEDALKGRNSGYHMLKSVLSPEEQLEMVKKAKAGDEGAAEQLVLSQFGYIIKQAAKMKKAYNYGFLDMNDLIQEGAQGVMDAIRNYDEESKIHFGWYSTFWIEKNIKRAAYSTTAAARPPEWRLIEWENIKNEIEELVKKADGEYIPEEEIVRQIKLKGYAEELIKEAIEMADCKTISLNEAAYDKNQTDCRPLIEAIPSDNKYKHWTNVSKEEIQFIQEIERAVQKLTNVEEYVITNYFGLEGDKYTLQEIGQKLGKEHSKWIHGKKQLTRAGVRLIRDRAIDKITKILYNGDSEMLKTLKER